MPLYHRELDTLRLIAPKSFQREKELQRLIEGNLGIIFNCRFVATEFSTGPVHGGRIDTLALSEENNPVIIEYKTVESSQLINQSLYYLSWMNDHRGDFEMQVRHRYREDDVPVDWSQIRVICIAPEYKKYDIHAVQMMGANIELWQYRYFQNDGLFLEEVYRRAAAYSDTPAVQAGKAESEGSEKDPVMVAAGKKAALTRATAQYSLDPHLAKINEKKRELLEQTREYLLSLDEAVEEVPKKFYVAYKVAQNFACLEVHKSKLLLYLKLKPAQLDGLPGNARDVTNIGHYGTGDLEVSVASNEELEAAKPYIRMAFDNIGGN